MRSKSLCPDCMAKEWNAMPKFAMFNARSEVVNDDKTAHRTFYAFCLAVWRVFNSPSAKIEAPTGGSTVDDEARTAINKIISAMEKFGITEE